MANFSRRTFLAGSSALGFPWAPAIAKTAYPARPIQFIVPAPGGSRHDVSARIFAGELQKVLGQAVDVTNPSGPSTSGHDAIASAAADGYTIGAVTVDITIMHWRGLTGLAPGNFTPIALFSEDPAGIHVKSNGAWASAKQLTDHLRANPGKLKASGTALGGIWHLSTVGWLAAAGLGREAMSWVASAGPAAAIEDLAFDGVDVVVCSVPEVRATSLSSSIKTLAVMSGRRNAAYGDIPTLREALGVPHSAGAWRGLAGPKGLPAEVASKLAAASRKVVESAGFRTAHGRRGFTGTWIGGAQFAHFLATQDATMGRIARAAGVAAKTG